VTGGNDGGDCSKDGAGRETVRTRCNRRWVCVWARDGQEILPKGWVEARDGRVRWIAGQCSNVMSEGVVEYGGGKKRLFFADRDVRRLSI
jgi:hypothetical protein